MIPEAATVSGATNSAQTRRERAGRPQVPPGPPRRADGALARENGEGSPLVPGPNHARRRGTHKAHPPRARRHRDHPRGDARELPQGRERTCPGDRGQATRGGFDPRPVANAAASGDRRIDPIATAACARGAFASRSQSLRANSTPDRAKGIRRAARPAPKGQRKS